VTSYRTLQYMTAFMTMPGTVVRAEVLRRWHGFDAGGSRWGEDAALWLKIVLNHPVRFQLRPLVGIDRGASELCSNLSGPRPIEPFLVDPGELEAACPPVLNPLLRRFLAYRACKAAIILGSWGQWEAARALARRYLSLRDFFIPEFVPALFGCTPAGGVLGRLFRSRLAAGQRRGLLSEKLT
jgi:hypothetical protein